mmetsp:Transcript_2271/g.7477  ORF Transcript_2271/g.7477 Transcript_2271/m.7477 type:complete len:285 (+) Transcript_2271:557-1411(+)
MERPLMEPLSSGLSIKYSSRTSLTSSLAMVATARGRVECITLSSAPRAAMPSPYRTSVSCHFLVTRRVLRRRLFSDGPDPGSESSSRRHRSGGDRLKSWSKEMVRPAPGRRSSLWLRGMATGAPAEDGEPATSDWAASAGGGEAVSAICATASAARALSVSRSHCVVDARSRRMPPAGGSPGGAPWRASAEPPEARRERTSSTRSARCVEYLRATAAGSPSEFWKRRTWSRMKSARTSENATPASVSCASGEPTEECVEKVRRPMPSPARARNTGRGPMCMAIR